MARSTNTRFAVAVHALTYLAGVGRERGTRPVGPVSSGELSESVNVNPVYIRRVLGPLRAAGLVRSWPGAHGGWELTADPSGVTLADVWRLVQRADPVLGLHVPSPSCPVGRGVQAALATVDRGVAAAVEAELERTTVRDVLARAIAEGAAGLRPSRCADRAGQAAFVATPAI